MILRFIFVLFLLLSNNDKAYAASLLSSIDGFSNQDRSEVLKDQMGGYSTGGRMPNGGSLYSHNKHQDSEPSEIIMPHLNSGCGGINVNFGGFGYIAGDQIAQMMKNISSSASSYTLMLTMKTLSPQVADVMENLEAIARSVNSQNINSCQMSAMISGGAFSKSENGQRLACQARYMESKGSQLSNYFNARERCNDAANVIAQNGQGGLFLPNEYNLVWNALGDASLSDEDKEFMMSISGTVVYSYSNGNAKFQYFPSLLKGNILNALMMNQQSNSNLKLYDCGGSNHCLEIQKVSRPFKEDDSVFYKTNKILSSIEKKIINEASGGANALTAEEKDLISKSSVPIFKLLSLQAGLKGEGASHALEDYSEAIAFDYVTNYLSNILDFVYRAVSNMEYAQIEGDIVGKFKEEIRSIKHELLQERIHSIHRLNTLLSIKQRTRQIELQFINSFGDYRGVIDNEQ